MPEADAAKEPAPFRQPFNTCLTKKGGQTSLNILLDLGLSQQDPGSGSVTSAKERPGAIDICDHHSASGPKHAHHLLKGPPLEFKGHMMKKESRDYSIKGGIGEGQVFCNRQLKMANLAPPLPLGYFHHRGRCVNADHLPSYQVTPDFRGKQACATPQVEEPLILLRRKHPQNGPIYPSLLAERHQWLNEVVKPDAVGEDPPGDGK